MVSCKECGEGVKRIAPQTLCTNTKAESRKRPGPMGGEASGDGDRLDRVKPTVKLGRA